MNSAAAIVETHLPLAQRRQGKVRDIYRLDPDPASGEPRLLIVASDRLSAFDVVLPTPIPGKGRLLTQVSLGWFERIAQAGIVPIHLLSDDPADIPGIDDGTRASLRGRVMISRACRVVPVECVVRGYLDGSGWVDYQQTGAICGIDLPAGLVRGDRLPEPIFTPATKEEVGTHDQNIGFEQACVVAGRETMETLRRISFEIYALATEYAESRGFILADTKFEFGFPLDAEGNATGDGPMLVDEALTSDSSRYWEASAWTPGGEQPSFDKQFVRDYLNRVVADGRWDKTAPGPELPQDVVDGTLERYQAVLERLFPERNAAH